MAYSEKEVIENGIEYIEKYDEFGERYAKFIKSDPFKEPEEILPEPTQLDRIENAVKKTQQDIIDEYTLELIKGGII